jgi:nucleoid-associated protein YgaU
MYLALQLYFQRRISKMTMRARFFILWFVLLTWASFAGTQNTLTYKDFEDQLSSVQQREKAAKEEIAQEQGKIETTHQQLADLAQKLNDVVLEKQALLGITEQDIQAIENEIEGIRSQCETLFGLSGSDLYAKKAEIDLSAQRLSSVKAKPVSYLWRIADNIKQVEDLIGRLAAKSAGAAPTPAATVEKQSAQTSSLSTSYTVQGDAGSRDFLYKIASSKEVYGDGSRWRELYRANKALIDKNYEHFKQRMGSDCKYVKPADLLFPGQVLVVPR